LRKNDEARYHFEHGDVWFRNGGRHFHVCGSSDFLAVVFDADDGTLHKHGNENLVTQWADKTRETFQSGIKNGIIPAELMPNLVVLAFPARQETLDELNACITTSGRVLKLEERLQAMEEIFGSAIRYPK